jgi:hypothetical protein
MRICDLKEEDIKVGLRLKSLASDSSNLVGTIVEIDPTHDNLAWIQWDGEDHPTSGFYGNDCACEIV